MILLIFFLISFQLISYIQIGILFSDNKFKTKKEFLLNLVPLYFIYDWSKSFYAKYKNLK